MDTADQDAIKYAAAKTILDLHFKAVEVNEIERQLEELRRDLTGAGPRRVVEKIATFAKHADYELWAESLADLFSKDLWQDQKLRAFDFRREALVTSAIV